MQSSGLQVDEGLVEAIALRIVELLDDDLRPGRDRNDLIDAAELARRLGMDRSWVYAHAAELGAERLGSGPNARLRFDPERATRALNPVGETPAPTERRPRRRSGRRRAPLLPVKGAPAPERELV